ARGLLYRFHLEGGAAAAPLARLPYPIFGMALDAQGNLWATTGGGPLLRLDPKSGAILEQFGDELTQSLALDPASGRFYVSSGRDIEIFDPVSHRFSHYSDIRVGNLAFAPDGSLWAAAWPKRGDVVRFDLANPQAAKRPEVLLHFDDAVDSLAFGPNNSPLQNLLFISHNVGPEDGVGGELTMVDLASVPTPRQGLQTTPRSVSVATGGSRGDVVQAMADGRVLLSQSHQIDVRSPLVPPRVAQANPPDTATVVLPLDGISVTFDSDMRQGDPVDPRSVLNPANYQIVGDMIGPVTVRAVSYDVTS